MKREGELTQCLLKQLGTMLLILITKTSQKIISLAMRTAKLLKVQGSSY